MSKFFHKKRIGEITKHCEGKKVLDIGCAGNETDLYREISKVADEIVGIDINEDVVNDLKDEGFEVYAADAQDFELEDEFEVVVLGNIIGYIPNGGKVLENINKHLKEEGILVTSILNPFSLEKFWNFEISDKGNSRVCYYSPRMFRNLTSTYGFKEKKIKYIVEKWSDYPTLKSKFFFLTSFPIPDKYRAPFWIGVYKKSKK